MIHKKIECIFITIIFIVSIGVYTYQHFTDLYNQMCEFWVLLLKVYEYLIHIAINDQSKLVSENHCSHSKLNNEILHLGGRILLGTAFAFTLINFFYKSRMDINHYELKNC